MIQTILKKLPGNAREWSIWLSTALMVFGGLRIFGLAGTLDMQDAAGLPGMSMSLLLGQLALDICLILAGYIGRKCARRAVKMKKCSKRAASLFSTALPR